MSYNSLFGLGTHSEDANLEGWHKSQETSGTSAVDSSSNALSGTITNMGSNPTTRTGPKGYLGSAFDFDGTNDYVVMPRIAAMESNTTYTVLSWLYSDSVSSSREVYAYRSTSSATPILAQIDTNGSDLRALVRGNGGTIANATATGQASTSGWMHAALVRNGNTITLYKNGSSAATATASVGTITAASPLAGAAYGLGNSTPVLFFDGGLCEQVVFTRDLSGSEVAEVYNGPEPVNTVAPTLSITTSSWSGTIGTWDSQSNGTLTYAWELRDADDDSVVESGTGSSPSGSGSYSGAYYLWVRGSNDGGYDTAEDSVSADETATGGGGAYTLTCDQATFSETGQDASLTASRLLTADNAAVVLSGQDVNLVASRLLTSDQASFSLSGQTANLVASRLLTADNATYSLSGQDVNLDYSGSAITYTLTCDHGSYALSGQDVSLLASRLLMLDNATFAISGQGATLSYSGQSEVPYLELDFASNNAAIGTLTATSATGSLVALQATGTLVVTDTET